MIMIKGLSKQTCSKQRNEKISSTLCFPVTFSQLYADLENIKIKYKHKLLKQNSS